MEREFISNAMSSTDYYQPMQGELAGDKNFFICAEHTGHDKLGYIYLKDYDKDNNQWTLYIDNSETSGDD